MEEVRRKLRREKLAARNKLTPAEIKRKSRKIAGWLFALPEFKNAATIMFYVSFANEVNTHDMISEALKLNKRVVVPKIGKNASLTIKEIKDFKRDLKKGCFGILEPRHSKRRSINKRKIDLAVVPGICFDLEKGARLGFGRGFYDRFLSGCHPHTTLIGLAFASQLTEKIPCTRQDVHMDKIITEKRVIEFKH
jgi:5-formyltetrahydrofolate cyclo-ligase